MTSKESSAPAPLKLKKTGTTSAPKAEGQGRKTFDKSNTKGFNQGKGNSGFRSKAKDGSEPPKKRTERKARTYEAPKVARVFNKNIAGTEPVPGLEAKTDSKAAPSFKESKDRPKRFNKDKDKRSFKKGSAEKAQKGCRFAVGCHSRAAAAKILDAVAQGTSLGEAFPVFCHNLDERDKAFAKEIVFGTLRQRRLLMQTMMPLVNHKITEKHRIVQSLLISAMYQIVFLGSPAHAVVSSTVSACGECGQSEFAPMVNAVLRRFLRENKELKHSDELAVEYSFPDWLYNRIQSAYPEQAEQIMKLSNERPPLILRIENSKISSEDYLKRLADKEIGASLVAPELSPSAVVLDVATNVNEIEGFNDGLCSVQDLSAQLVAPLMELDGPNADSLRVLDCCCAPGGKTAHILDINPKCELIALDSDYGRLQQATATLSRLHKDAQLQVQDAQNLSSIKGLFDRILVDAPCSGTGVIRRHPDIKWLRREKDIENLTKIQANILDAAFDKLASGGILLYTTCSILPEENDEQVKAFLSRHKDAVLKPFTIGGKEFTTCQRLPGDDNGDGFFYAKIVKTV